MGSKLGSFFRSLVGSSESEGGQPDSRNAVDYNGYLIHPASRKEGSQWRTEGVITKDVEGETKEHRFIRADVYTTKEDADNCAVTKAKRIIDEQGDRLFQ